MNISSSRSRASGSNEIVFSETRSINENESVGITQYTSGITIIVHSDSSTFTVKNTDSNASTVGTDLIGDASFTVGVTGESGLFKLSNVGYIVTQNGTMYFTSSGTASVTNSSITYTRTQNTSTNINYNIRFSSSAFDSFSLYFYNNSLIATMGPY